MHCPRSFYTDFWDPDLNHLGYLAQCDEKVSLLIVIWCKSTSSGHSHCREQASPQSQVLSLTHVFAAFSRYRSSSCFPQTIVCCWDAGTNVDKCFAWCGQITEQKMQNPSLSFDCHFCGFVWQINISVLTMRINTLKSRAQYAFVVTVMWKIEDAYYLRALCFPWAFWRFTLQQELFLVSPFIFFLPAEDSTLWGSCEN